MILGVWILLGGLAVLFLPETLHRRMPNTLAEGEMFTSTRNVFRWTKEARVKKILESENTIEDVMI